MLEILGMAGATTATLAVMVPSRYWPRLVAYPVVVDLLASGYVVSTMAATGTISGLQVAVFSALFITVSIRVAKKLIGSERLAVDGDINPYVVAAAVLTQASSWIKALTKSLFTRQAVQAPEPVNWSWVKTA